MLTEARHFYLIGPILMPMLERRRKLTLQKLIMRYREGNTEFLALVSELAAFDAIESEIKQQEQIYLTMEAANGNRNN